jgi:predicted Zn-dependent protease
MKGFVVLFVAAALAAPLGGGAPLTLPGMGGGAPPAGSAAKWADNVQVRMARGFTRQADAMLVTALDAHPNDPVLLPMAGIVRASVGDYASTLVATDGELLDGPKVQQAAASRATALRHSGDPEGAAALRAEGLMRAGLTPPQEAMLWSAISADHLAAGDHEAAYDAAMAAMAADPASPRPYVALAELALEQGDLDEAVIQLELAQRGRATPRALVHLEGRLALELESPAHAFRVIFNAARSILGGRLDPEMTALLVEARRRQGWASGARSVQERESLMFNQELWHPALLATRAMVRADAGDLTGAAETLHRAQALYPDHAWVRAAAVALEPDLPGG